MSEELMDYTNTETETQIPEPEPRKNPFTVISLATFGQYSIRDIQSNSAWSKNPYPGTHVIVPDDLAADILETRGFCDITLNDGGTEIIGFTPLEIPDIPEPTPEPTMSERVSALEEQQLATDEVAVELYEQQLAQEEINMAQDEAITAIYEMMEV